MQFKIAFVPLICDLCMTECGAIVFKELDDARKFRDCKSIYTCKSCYEAAQEESLERKLKWTRIN
jgi:hypothetical protein